MLCPTCASDQPGSHRFCAECGAALREDISSGPSHHEAARVAALLRVFHELAFDPSPETILDHLLAEAIQALGVEGGSVYRWDPRAAQLALIRTTFLDADPRLVTSLTPGQGALGQAAERRAPVIIHEYQRAINAFAAWTEVGIQAAAAVPLLNEGRLLGALCVDSFQPGKRFSASDVDLLELLAGAAAAVLVGLEQARLGGVLLAARTAQHEMNNKLALTVGYAELLTLDPALSPASRNAARECLRGASEAAAMLHQLQQVIEVQVTDWGTPSGPTIDLARSAHSSRAPQAPPSAGPAS